MAEKFEYLNTFFSERLLAVAGELFQVVTDIVSEIQEETDRTKQENMYLKELLAAERLANRRDELSHQAVPRQLADISPGPLDSNPSVMQVKVELSTTKQDNVPPESMNDSSAMTRQAVPRQLPDISPGPVDSNPSVMQVKVELSTTRQVNAPPESMNDSCAASTPHYVITSEEINSDRLHNYSDVKIKSEPPDTQIVISDDSNPAMPSESVIDDRLVGLRDDQGSDPCAHDALQCEAAERVVYCQCCGKAFGNHNQLKRHTAAHQKRHKKDSPRPYRCDLCGKSYSCAQVLKVHQRIHTGERPYDCKLCGRRFKHTGHLKEHERIHTGEKPFGCPVCGRRFIQSSHFRKHVRYQHPTIQHQSAEG